MTSPVKSPLPTLKEVVFGDALMEYDAPQLCVMAGGDLRQGISTACDLADGIRQLSMRLHKCIGDGEIAYAAEVKALAFLAETVHALTTSALFALAGTTEDPTPEVIQ